MSADRIFSNEFYDELIREEPNYSFIREQIILAYNKNTSSDLPLNINKTDDGLISVVRWLNKIEMDSEEVLFFRKKPILKGVFFSDLSSKVNVLSQHHCLICKGNSVISTIPIRIRPISYQHPDSKIKKAFKEAIKQRLAKSEKYSNVRLCVHTTFLIGRKNDKKDLDNMAKILMDGMQKSKIFGNDNQIDHLSLMKILCNVNEDYLVINIRESTVNSHDDILYEGMHHSWAGVEPLDLSNFTE